MGEIEVSEQEMAEKANFAVSFMSFTDIMATSPSITRLQMLNALKNTCELIIKNEY